MSTIASEVTAAGMTQSAAATAVNTAVTSMGLRTAGVVQVGENAVVASVQLGAGKPVMVVAPNGVVRAATATIDVAKKTGDLIIKDIEFPK